MPFSLNGRLLARHHTFVREPASVLARSGSFAGQVASSQVFLALVVNPISKTVGYVCESQGVAEWFQGTASGQTLDLASKDGRACTPTSRTKRPVGPSLSMGSPMPSPPSWPARRRACTGPGPPSGDAPTWAGAGPGPPGRPARGILPLPSRRQRQPVRWRPPLPRSL